ncbi:cell wall-binding repeat-containing protein [Candidatus Poriferisodalis sp.]|uniref:cell wall-binding repeat-containing protein n=1 Tax=Candidatus Poriferisodalis sp. TaxID=3101277 RepID=UPI003B01D562
MEREFAGQDRYDTGIRLAKNFGTSKGGLGAVPTAFVASGGSLVDSISVAGLAGYADAPILLTTSGGLHRNVADFVEDYDVRTVYVLGGSAAVSDEAVTAIEALDAKPSVTRIAGDDRYATAAAIAAKIDAESSWCGTDAVSAVLINGSSEALAFGVAVQTVAYRLQLPVLMTAADELPDATAEYITANDVEHVQIVGGTGTVSAGVASALTTLGVDTVDRVDGDSAAEVSVALANMANNGCGDDLAPVSVNRAALVRGNPDGVVAAPVLASSLANGELVTPLIVGDTLPASVRDYLAATPKVVAGAKLALGIVAVGGTAAVSEATMDAAVEAAASAGALSVSIGAMDDTNNDKKTDADDPVRPGTMFSLYFSDDVEGTDAELLAKVRDIVEVNGVVARVSAASTESGDGVCTPRRVDVTLAKALANGDTISIASSAHTFGTDDDQRRLAAVASERVVAAPADTARPTVKIIGIANEEAFQIRVSDDRGIAASTAIESGDLVFNSGRGAATRGTITPPSSLVDTDDNPVKAATWTVAVARDAGAGGTGVEANVLVAGDRLRLNSGAVVDTSANVNAAAAGRAIAEQASPRAVSVLMSSPLHSAQTRWSVPTAFFPSDTPGDHEIFISAKASGDAAGAAGNAWSMVFDTPSTYSAAKDADIDVRVDTKGKTVTVRFNNGPVTVASLLAALTANADFDARFSANTGCDAVATTRLEPSTAADDRDSVAGFVDAAGDTSTTGIGMTQFAVEVRFSGYIATVSADELLADILARTVARNRANEAADSVTELRTLLGIASVGNALSIVGSAPGTTVRYEMTTASTAYMPQARDLVDIAAGHTGAAAITADAAAGNAAHPAITAVPAVATGYAPDAPTRLNATTINNTGAQDRVDEDKNGASQPRITVSASVKARN